MVEDAAAPDAALLDAALPDAALPDMFPFDPEPFCAERTEFMLDVAEGFEQVEAPPGYAHFASDHDMDGVASLFLWDFLPNPELGFDTVGNFGHSIWNLKEAPPVIGGRIRNARPMNFAQSPDGTVLVGFSQFPLPATGSTTPWHYASTTRPMDGALTGECPTWWRWTGGIYSGDIQAELLDADGDARPDVLAGGGGRCLLYELRGDELVVTHRNSDPPYDPFFGDGGRVTWGDFDQDGRMEVVMPGPHARVDADGRQYTVRHARIIENRGDDTYAVTWRILEVNKVAFSARGDFDGDGKLDFLMGGSNSGTCARYEVWTADGDDHYRKVWAIDSVWERDYAFDLGTTAFGDTDGDGDDELLIAKEREVALFEWNGVTFEQIFGTWTCDDCGWTQVWLEDLDGDGRKEVIFNRASGAYLREHSPPYLQPGGIAIYRRLD